MRIIIPANTLHEVVYFLGVAKQFSGGPHHLFIPSLSPVGRDSLHRIQQFVSYTIPWVKSVTRGLPEDLQFDLDMRGFAQRQTDRSLHLMMCLFCGLRELPSWLPRVVSDETTIVIARSCRQQNELFPWAKVIEQLHKIGRIIFCGDEEEYTSFKPCIPDALQVDWVLTEDLTEAFKVVSQASLFVGNQGIMQALATGVGVPSVIEVSPASPDNIFIEPPHKISFTGKVIIPSIKGGQEIVIHSEPTFFSLPDHPVKPPFLGWQVPSGSVSRRFADLDEAVFYYRKKFDPKENSYLVREKVVVYTAFHNPEWAVEALRGRLFRKIFAALRELGDTNSLESYFSPIQTDPSLCKS